MSVVFLNPVGALGGGERSLVDLVAVLRAARPAWRLRVVCGTDGPLVEEAARVGAEAVVVPMPAALAGLGDSGLARTERGRGRRAAGMAARAALAAAGLPGYLARLRRAVAAARPRLVHSNGMKCHFLAGHVSPRGVPVVWHVHDFLSTRVLAGTWLRRLARKPALAIANSHAVAADAARLLPGVAVEAVYNSIDTDAFAPGPPGGADLDRLARLAPAPPGAVRIGLVATYARWKGQDVFIEAAARLAARPGLPPLRFYIVGGPIYQTAGSQFSEAELRGLVRRHGLDARVGLVPFQRQLPPVYRGLDVVVHASTRPEPFGLTIVEAMACGRAVTVADAGGAAELFTDGVDAVGVPPGSVGPLADAVAALAADPERRARLGAAARDAAVARFSRPRMAARLLAVYDSVLTQV